MEPDLSGSRQDIARAIFQAPPAPFADSANANTAPAAPTPLIRDRPLAEAPPVDALGPLRPAVLAIESVTKAPTAIALQSVLGTASLATQAHADVESLNGPRPTSLFLLTVAMSGERKSACDSLAMRAVREIERDRSRSYQAARERHQIALARHEAERTRLAKDSEVIENEADLAALGAPPSPPLAPHLLLPDPTIEGLQRYFEEGRPALGIFSDEGGQLLGGHGMSRENRLKTAAGFSKLWDGEPMNRTRASGPSTTYRGRRVAAHLMIQPQAADAFLGDEVFLSQGLTNRFLIAWPESTMGLRFIPEGQDLAQMAQARRGAEEALATFSDRIREMLEATPHTANDDLRELRPRRLALSHAARDVLVGFYNTCEHELRVGGGLESMRGFASKTAEQAARIAGVLTLFDDLAAEEVSGATMAAATRLMTWYLGEAQRLLNTGEIDPLMQKAETLRAWLLDRSGRDVISVRTIYRYGPPSIRDGELARRLVKTLVQYGWLVPVPGPVKLEGHMVREAWRVVRG